MRTSGERITSLHERMKKYRRKQEQRQTMLTGTACICLALCLVFIIFKETVHPTGFIDPANTVNTTGTAHLYSGSMMLSENAGGYVLAAIIAFMVGVVITVICLHLKNNQKRKDCASREKSSEQEEEDSN